jgi:hypothetical protein
MKRMTIGEIVKHPGHPIMQDVLRNERTKSGDKNKCIRCQKIYKRGFWDFYSLCDECFVLFDAQKMSYRFGLSKEGYENAQEWIENEKGGAKK